MILQPQILDDEVVPERELVVHRHDELEHLLRELRPVDGSAVTGHTYILGPTGVGKTLLAKLCLEILAEGGVDFRSAYVNCWEHYDRYAVLFHVVQKAVGVVRLHRNATPRSELVDHLHEQPDVPRYVILDEVDQLTDKGVLYDLHGSPQLKVIYIANNEEGLFATLDDRIHSRITVGSRIEFEKYTVSELAEILKKRAEYGLHPGVVTDRQLETMARHASGDARVAICILRTAAETARQNGHNRIEAVDIEAAIPVAKRQLKQKSVDQLNDHQRVLYEIIATHGPIAPRDIFARYETTVESPRSERTMRTYLKKLSHYRLIAASGARQTRTYSLYES